MVGAPAPAAPPPAAPPGAPPHARPDADAAAPLARLDRVSKRFGPVVALDAVSLDVPRGRVLGVIGRSGAGKSTLIRLLNGLERPDTGSVTFEGQELTGLSERALQPVRQRIGMIFQHFNLLSAKTVAANVALPLRIVGQDRAARARRVAELLDLVGLADKARAYPAQLSGGQKQRVGIARALAAEPRLLLSDEATSALDAETTGAILELLRDINRRLGLSIVLITHELSVVRAVADEVAVLEAGQLVERGPVAAVFTRPASAAARALVDAGRAPVPEALRARWTAPPGPASDPVLLLQLLGPDAHRPLLTRLAAALDAEVTLLHGGVEHVQATPTGRLWIGLRARDPAAAAELGPRAVAALHGAVSHAEVVGHVARAV
jgi:D-methionine transport system ATP-binding protein